MTIIHNKKQLVENGKTILIKKARAIALTSLEHALDGADPRKLMLSKLSMQGSCLRVGNCEFDLRTLKNVYVVGAGKAGAVMADALEEILDGQITEGIVNVPYGAKLKTAIIELLEAAHPIPDESGVEGAKRIMAIAEKARKEDLVICLISGGGSSLLPLPRKGVTLEEKREITESLLKSGASIGEINIVRKHLSAVKGGWLAKITYPARLLTLILSDVVGDPLSAVASGPTVPDPSTFVDAKRVLESHGLWHGMRVSVRKLLTDGIMGLIEETPKPGNPVFERACNVVVGNNKLACDAAVDYLKSEGLNTLQVEEPLTGEAREAGKILALCARRVNSFGKPVAKPAAVVAGGETTVTVVGKGRGGRNQELALSAVLHLKKAETCVCASIGSDGIDGFTEAAGAIVDGFTLSRAESLGLNAERFLVENDSYSFFSRSGDLIITGATGTNVNDISVIVIL